MPFIYLVAWSGGSQYEPPQYEVTSTKDSAIKLAQKWAQDIGPEDGDDLDVLQIDPVTLVLDRIEVPPA
jgi:hypothetical protein